MMAYRGDDTALAAEYALGTLDLDERAQVEAMMAGDKDFAGVVETWQSRLGVLNQMVGSVEPRPEVWDRIRTAAGLSEPQAPLVLPETPRPAPVAPEAAGPAVAADGSEVVRLAARARHWRSVAGVTTAIAAALVAMMAVGAYRPDLLPERFRLKPVDQTVEVKTPSAAPSAAQY